MRRDEWGDPDLTMVAVAALVMLAILIAGLLFLAYDTPEMDGSHAGSNAATVEQIRRDG